MTVQDAKKAILREAKASHDRGRKLRRANDERCTWHFGHYHGLKLARRMLNGLSVKSPLAASEKRT